MPTEDRKEQVNEEAEKQEVEQTQEEVHSEDIPTSEEVEDVNPSQIEELKKENEELEERNLRLQAEIANMRRISQREQQESAKYRSQSLAKELLDGIDNLERALQTDVTSEDGKQLLKGVEMVRNQFITAFEKEKIKAIDPFNEPFDPAYHQAVSVVPTEEGQESQTVVTVLQKGYVLNDRILRPAMVVVTE